MGVMSQTDAYKQFSFRLPPDLVDDVEQCLSSLRRQGLDVTRADVVRMLLKHALAATRCKIDRLLKADRAKSKRAD